MPGNIIALRYSFDLVCPYSYILAHEVEEAEDEGLVEVEWLPFELRPAPRRCPSRAASTSVTTGASTSTGSLRTTGSRYTFPLPASLHARPDGRTSLEGIAFVVDEPLTCIAGNRQPSGRAP